MRKHTVLQMGEWPILMLLAAGILQFAKVAQDSSVRTNICERPEA